ncbi:unnamed protein product, partial [Mesorhabditis belari]|uniref:non-specific serine/threonine protein kinase n=1 Tax=Mesorhabditis belari TaxID=2138241 RepID=A0AAF3JA40_9BILA
MPPKKVPLHQLAPPLPQKTPLRDVSTKKIYHIGTQIATGGFGRIYSCSEEGSRKENYCCKVEPQGNGPLFTEVNVFQRILRAADINAYKTGRKITWLGVPPMISTGIFDYKQDKLRYLIIPKYATSLEEIREKKKVFDPKACLKIVKCVLDALEYLHTKSYVHADIKAGNILLEDPANLSTSVLVDYGLARMASANVEKPDKKRAHNGTAIFTSIDAHRGLNPSYRGDIEILGYNVIYWLTGTLPWQNLESNAEKVFAAKQDFVKDVKENLKKVLEKHQSCFSWVEKLFRVALDTPYTSGVNFKQIHQACNTGSTASPAKKATPSVVRASTKRSSTEDEENRKDVKKAKVTAPAKATRVERKKVFVKEVNASESDSSPSPVVTPLKRANGVAHTSSAPTSKQNGQNGIIKKSRVATAIKQDPQQLRTKVPGMLNFATKGRRSIIINKIAKRSRRKATSSQENDDNSESSEI